jgi:hypothetical protein
MLHVKRYREDNSSAICNSDRAWFEGDPTFQAHCSEEESEEEATHVSPSVAVERWNPLYCFLWTITETVNPKINRQEYHQN